MVGTLSALNLLLMLFFLTIPLPLQAQEQPKKIIIAGAQSIVPLAEQFSAQFRNGHPGIEIVLRGGGSNYAVNAVRHREIDIGLITRNLNAIEKKEFHVEAFGQDAIVLLTYPGNSVTSLTLEQIRRIYLGKSANWREVGGEEKGIIPLARERGSAIHTTFIDHLFGKGFKGQEKAFTIRAGKEKILKTIKRIEGCIGYGIVRLEEAEAQGVKVLGVEGKFPTAGNIREGLYPFIRPQLVISHGAPNGAVREWMTGFAKFANRNAPLEERP